MSKRKYFMTREEIEVIRAHYDGSTIAINRIMRILNANGAKYPRWHVRRLASENGWAKAKMPDWSPEEEEYLAKKYPNKGFVAIQNGLKRINGGVHRSVTAIVLKKKRIHISKRSMGLTMRMMEDLLGVDHHKVEKWMSLGELSARRKGTERTEVQGGDMWHFEPKKVRKFIINNPEEIDVRKVEPLGFIHLVAGMME